MTTLIIAAITTDGFIARDSDQISTSWTSKEDRKFFSERSKQAGVVIFGAKTYQTIGKPLPGRLNVIYSKTATRTQPEGTTPDQLLFTSQAPQELLATLEQKGFQEVVIGGGATIYSMFMKAGLVDKIYLTVEPVLFGKGIKLFSDEVQADLKLVQLTKLNENSLLLEYDVVK
jgi:dihydrofolate reductase